jgi:hypothetical protein
MKAKLVRFRPWSGLALLALLMGIFVVMEFGRIGNEYWEAVEAGWPDIPSYSRVPEVPPDWHATGTLRCRDGWLEQEMVNRIWGIIPRHQWTVVWAGGAAAVRDDNGYAPGHATRRLPCPF